jgi:phage-related protein
MGGGMEQLTQSIYVGTEFSIEAYVQENGDSPATEWLDNLNQKERSKFIALFKRLGDIGKIYDETKFKHLTGSDHIYEFKYDSNRVLSFFFKGKKVILTHGFTKKSQKTPSGEIEKGEAIKKEFERRSKQ